MARGAGLFLAARTCRQPRDPRARPQHIVVDPGDCLHAARCLSNRSGHAALWRSVRTFPGKRPDAADAGASRLSCRRSTLPATCYLEVSSSARGGNRGAIRSSTPASAGVREYVQGDALNRISWTTSARLGRLMVKEFDLDPTSDVWIVVDLERLHHRRASADHPGHAGRRTPDWLDSTEEYVVSIAASLAKMALDDGRAVGMVVSSGRTTVINPDRTERQLRRVLEQLALEHADGVRPLQEVLLSESYRFRRQSALIVVSPSPDEGWTTSLAAIAGRRVPVSAVILDATTFGTSQSRTEGHWPVSGEFHPCAASLLWR